MILNDTLFKILCKFLLRKNHSMELIISVKVTPQSGKSEWKLAKNGTLQCFLKSAPEKNKANDELVALTSTLLKIPKHSISILKGELARYKTLKIITNLTYQAFLRQVGIIDSPQSFL